jgi:hypothetical protein
MKMKRFLVIALLLMLSVSLYAIPQPQFVGPGGTSQSRSDSGIPQPQFVGPGSSSESQSDSDDVPQPQFFGPAPSERASPPESPPNTIGATVYVGACDHWRYVDSHRFFLCIGDQAVCLVECLYAYIYPTSRIHLLKSELSSYGEILVDGETEEVTDVSRP